MAEEKTVLKEKARTIRTKTKPKFGSGTVKFVKESIMELKKVVWPTKRQLAINTTIVIIASAIMALFITGIDTILNYVDMSLLK